MTNSAPQIVVHKLSLIWSSRQARDIPVRITYSTAKQHGCQLYRIEKVEELEKKAA